MKQAPTRGRRIFIVKGQEPGVQPDFWPYDEVWSDDLTCLGSVDENGVFIPNPQFGKETN